MRAPSKDVLPLYFDVAYSGAPMQCSTKDGTCAALQREYRFDLEMTAAQENQYKYVLDVDANYASGKFKRLMYVFLPLPVSGSLESVGTPLTFRAAHLDAGARDRSSSSRLSSENGGRSVSCR